MGTSLLNRIREDRQSEDYYATPEEATRLFLDNYRGLKELKNIWEPACGEGHMSEVLKDYLLEVKSSDLIDRGYGETMDFIESDIHFPGSIITNPPFKIAETFLKKGLEIIGENEKVIFLLRLQFLESSSRKPLLENHLSEIYIHSRRIGCGRNGDFSSVGKAICYAWFVFQKDFKEAPKIYWI